MILVARSRWIIEGCSISTLEMRFARADTIIYFHLPRLLCVWRVFKRWFVHVGKVCRGAFSRNQALYDVIDGGLKTVNWEMLRYIWTFDQDKREGIESLSKKYPHVNFLVFTSSQEAAQYLEALTIRQL